MVHKGNAGVDVDLNYGNPSLLHLEFFLVPLDS